MWEVSNMKSAWNKSLDPTDKNRPQMKRDSIRGEFFFFFIVLSFGACGSSEIKPVDIYPEDMCSQCRMAISDQSFAAEIIAEAEEVYKFDDLGCMEKFKEKSGALKIAAIFVKDYGTKTWLPFARSIIIQTGLKTPMSSGKVAFADSSLAKEFLRKYVTQ